MTFKMIRGLIMTSNKRFGLEVAEDDHPVDLRCGDQPKNRRG